MVENSVIEIGKATLIFLEFQPSKLKPSKSTTTTTTKHPDWHTHPGMPEGHIHPTRAQIN